MEEQEQQQDRPVEVYVIDPSIKLNAKQARFVYEYLIDYNATQAGIRAGYSKKTAGSQAHDLLKKPEIIKAIDDGKWFYQYQNGIDAHWIRQQMVSLFHKCMQEEEVMRYDHASKSMVGTGEYVFKDATARATLELMAKDIGMLAPTKVAVDHSGKVGHEHTVKEQMDFDAVREKVKKHNNLRLVKNG